MYQDPGEGDFIGVFCFQRDIKRGACVSFDAGFAKGFNASRAQVGLPWQDP
jgi:hypothetical protein